MIGRQSKHISEVRSNIQGQVVTNAVNADEIPIGENPIQLPWRD